MLPSQSAQEPHAIPETSDRGASRARAHLSKSTLFLLLLLTCCSLSQAFRSSKTTAGIDFYQFWAVGRAVARNDATDVYTDRGRAQLGATFLAEAYRGTSPMQRVVAEHRRVFETTATPFLYGVFGSLTSDDYVANLQAYRALSLACFAFSVITLARLLGHSISNALVSLSVFCLWFEPLASDLRVGNVSCIQLASIVLYACLRLKLRDDHRFWIAGSWLGLVIMFKPNLAFVPLLMLLASLYGRQWKALLQEGTGLALGATVALGWSSWCLGSAHAWVDWFAALGRVPDQNITMAFGNFSPWVLFRELFGSGAKSVVILAALAATAIGYYSRMAARAAPLPQGERARDDHRVIWLLALGCLGPVLLPHLAWLHYFVLTVPALLVVLVGVLRQTTRWRGAWISLWAAAAWLGLSVNVFTVVGVTFSALAYAATVITASYALLTATVGSRDEI